MAADLSTLSKERFLGYSFLAGMLLKEPTIESLKELARFLAKSGNQIKETYIGFALDTYLEMQKQEYYDCFFVPKSGLYVPPFESALLEYNPDSAKERFGFMRPIIAASVQKDYDRFGFVPWKLNIFMPLKGIRTADHIGYETAFLAELCRREKITTKSDLKKLWKIQYDFLAKHLLGITQNFWKALCDTKAALYQNVALALFIWSEQDRILLKHALEEGKDE